MDLESYAAQTERWPREGRVILAQFDATSVVVYQAYRPEIGHFAAQHQYFGGSFKMGRMTWIKPNFLWMMYRSDWGRSEGQEVVLAVRIRREAFDGILAAAVHSSFTPEVYASHEQWQARLQSSEVRLQWDPDHGPSGERLERRAIQLGLRGGFVEAYAREWIVGIEDVSALVAEQRVHAGERRLDALMTPREEVYPVEPETARRLGVDAG